MLTYADSAALMVDATFISRIKVACLHFASYILGEDPGTAAHNSRTKWAQQAMQNPDGVASQISPGVVMDPNVQSQGATIADADLQTAVETTVNRLI